MPYGLDAWGLDVWGVDPTLRMESAVAATTHSVIVTTTTPTSQVSPIAPGDALNPRTWTVARDDDSVVFTPIGVLSLGDRRVQIFLRNSLQSWNREHKVGSTTLRSSMGHLVSSPYSLLFRGVLPTTAVNEPNVLFDLKTTDIIGGSLQTTEAGGYARIYGDDVIRKMIYRRLTTMPGSFFHIAPGDFGAGLKIKGILRASSLSALKARIQTEILKEPGVKEVNVGLTLGNGVLSIAAKVRTQLGLTEVSVTAS